MMGTVSTENRYKALVHEERPLKTFFKAVKVYHKGDMDPLCRFMEERYFKVFHNRDYRWANELTIKTAFLTLLYNDIIYIMDSEKEIDRRYADLTMIIRPDKRYGKVFDVLNRIQICKA